MFSFPAIDFVHQLVQGQGKHDPDVASGSERHPGWSSSDLLILGHSPFVTKVESDELRLYRTAMSKNSIFWDNDYVTLKNNFRRSQHGFLTETAVENETRLLLLESRLP